MKRLLYFRLAAEGIRNNSRFYVPYFFACTVLMMIFYITEFLAGSEFVEMQPGGTMIGAVLDIGWIILTAFSAVFLFYTNSFIIKRRKTEFGLYNILGMGKSNIMLILVCEIGMIFGGSFLLGTGLGIAFSKLVEIMLIKILGGENSYDFSINSLVITEEFCIFLALFGIILVRGMRQIRINNAVGLFRSDHSGEKAPRANWVLAVLGAVLLIAGYILANIVENWIWALIAFFCAVILVIAATYLLFISGSTFVCRLLRKNKKYYYKTSHFISVAQMDFRMKKNGAGLASICILATMTLVLISAVSGLYFGSEQIMRQKYPRDVSYNITSDSGELVEQLTDTMIDTARDLGAEPENIVRYRLLADEDYYTHYRGKKMITAEELDSMPLHEYNELEENHPFTIFYLVPVSDYNEVMRQNVEVKRGEALVLKMPSEPSGDTYDYIPVKGGIYSEDVYSSDGEFIETKKRYDTAYLKCAGTVDDFVVVDGNHLIESENSGLGDLKIITRYAFINDDDFEEQYQWLAELSHDMNDWDEFTLISPTMGHYFGMDLNCGDETMLKIAMETEKRNEPYIQKSEEFYTVDGKTYKNWNPASTNGIYNTRAEFYSLYGGLFFLGVLFCAVFVAAAVMIMYYKQITEGYEDRSRYQILQKVGMTKDEIRAAINSQVRAMFFLPLIAAGVHTVFAFGLITKLLTLFGAMNTGSLALVAVVCFLAYAVVYAAVYSLTSRIYFRIVAD